MADTYMPKPDELDSREVSASEIHRVYEPPFLVEIVDGYCDIYEDNCFSSGEEYYILKKVKVPSVIATTFETFEQDLRLKIPIKYEGKFYPLCNSQIAHPKEVTVGDLLASNELPVEIQFSNQQQHGKYFLQNLQKTVRCNFRLTDWVTDIYYVGKSPDGDTVLLFSTQMDQDMKFRIRKVNELDVKHLMFDKTDLKYDIFVATVDNSLLRCMALGDAIYNRPPPRPPKPGERSGKAWEAISASSCCIWLFIRSWLQGFLSDSATVRIDTADVQTYLIHAPQRL